MTSLFSIYSQIITQGLVESFGFRVVRGQVYVKNASPSDFTFQPDVAFVEFDYLFANEKA